MAKLPVFLEIEKKKVLVVGGAVAAFIKVKTLLAFDADIILVSENVLEEIKEEIKKEEKLEIYERKFSQSDLDGIFIVFAMADENTNYEVYRESKKRGILCAMANGSGDFILPAHKKEGSLTIAVSTNGKYPLLAKKICDDFYFSKQELDFLENQRRLVIKNEPDKNERRKVLREILNASLDKAEIENIVRRYKNES